MNPLHPYAIRRAVPADVDAMAEVHQQSIRTLCAADYTPEVIEAWTRWSDKRRQHFCSFLESDPDVFVAHLDGQVVGFSELGQDNIRAVYTHPDHVRYGIGSQLLQQAIHAARAAGITQLKVDSTHTAEPFYARHGFLTTGRGVHRLNSGVEVACVFMTLLLG